MSYRSLLERRHEFNRRLKSAGAIAAVGVLLLWLDRPLYVLLAGDEVRLERGDWYQMLRAVGFLPTWLVLGGAIALVERGSGSRRPGGLTIMLAATASGLAAEVLKLLLGRHRPDAGGHLEWNPLFGAIYDPDKYGSSLGLPSSHAAVAFGGAVAVALLYPGARWVALVAASGCALTRLLAGAHASSDVYLAVLVAWGVACLSARATGTGPARRCPRLG